MCVCLWRCVQLEAADLKATVAPNIHTNIYTYAYIYICMYICVYTTFHRIKMHTRSWDEFAEYSLFYRALLQKRPVILGSLPTFHRIEMDTGSQRLIGCLKLQVIFRKGATNYGALLQKMTYNDKVSYGSSAPCTRCQDEFAQYVYLTNIGLFCRI